MVKLSELKKKFEEELKKKQEEQKVLNGVHEEVDILVIDMGYTAGGLANLYSLMDGYVTTITEQVKEIEQIVRAGKVAKVKAIRIVGTKRLVEIKEVKEEDDPDVPENKIWEGVIEYLPPRLRFIRNDGEVYWIDMGSMSYERLANMEPGTYNAILIPALVYTRRSSDGTRVFNRIRGFYFIIPEKEESVTEQYGEQAVQATSPEQLPDTVHV